MILHTEVTGEGEALVFLHTALQTGIIELDRQREYFKENYQVILPDLRGHGKSVVQSFDLDNFLQKSADDLAETLDNLNIQAIHLAGCSIGGLVALMFSKKYPSRIKTLTLSGIIPEKPENWDEINQEENENITNILNNKETAAYFDGIHEGDWRAVLASTAGSDWYPFEETNDLSELNMPVLFIVGENASLETVGIVKYPQSNENIHVSVIPFAGHIVHNDQPDSYNLIFEQFLKAAGSK